MSRQHISDAGSLAEEVISTIRTAQAFGTQEALAEIYDTHIDKSKKVDSSAAVWHGAGLACFFFVIYSAYGLAFSFGTTLINEGHGQYIHVASSDFRTHFIVGSNTRSNSKCTFRGAHRFFLFGSARA